MIGLKAAGIAALALAICTAGYYLGDFLLPKFWAWMSADQRNAKFVTFMALFLYAFVMAYMILSR